MSPLIFYHVYACFAMKNNKYIRLRNTIKRVFFNERIRVLYFICIFAEQDIYFTIKREKQI